MSVTRDPTSATSDGGADEDIDPRVVDDATRRIAHDHPSQPVSRIEALLGDHLSTTRGAKVRTFRLLLAERSTRQQLHREDPDHVG